MNSCEHPAHRLFTWFVTDNGQRVLMLACLECHTVLCGTI